jgi:prepilin-type N-terminal cleavage/methylation domain-containing protein
MNQIEEIRAMQGTADRSTSAAFTLFELLLVIAIVAILTALVMPAIGRLRQTSQRAAAISNMRQIGSAIHLYAGEKGTLPGPLWPGQMPLLDPARSGRLVRELAPYLGIPVPAKPQLVDLFVPPAYRRAPGAPALENARTYVMNMAVSAEGELKNPWGSLADATPGAPLPPAAIPAGAWAFSDADRLHPRVMGAPWRANTPEAPIHSPRRLALFFDGHVDGISDDELAAPTFPP